MRLVVAVVAALLSLGAAQLPCAAYTPLKAVLETCVSPNTAHVSHTSSAIASSSALVVVGGYSISTGQPVIANTVQVYSPSSPHTAVHPTLSIASGGPKTNTQQFLPGSRIEHAAVVWEDAIFIYAGTNTDIMGDLWRLCVGSPYTSGIWDQVLNATMYIPTARTGHSATTLLVNATSSVHLVFGGTLASSYAASNETVFMVLTKPSGGGVGCQSAVPSVTWQPLALLPNTSSPLGRAYHSMTLNRDESSRSCFVLYGGQSLFNNSIFSDVWTLCPTLPSTQASVEQQTYVWTQLEQLGTTPPPRFGHTAIASYINRFVVLGGSFRFPSDYMSDGWEFNLALLRWLPLPLAYTNGSFLSPRRAHSTNYLNATKTLVLLGGVGRYALVTGNSIQCAYTSAQCASGLVQVYCNATGEIVCQPCAAGSYAALGDATCRTCPPGTYAVEGASSCTLCPLGTYSGLVAAPSLASCLSCPKGTYSSVPQATSIANCTQCPAGTFAAQAGSSACSPCSAGYYSVGNATQCAACPGGTFSPPTASTCTNCSAGTYAPSTAMGACLGCPRGMYSNASALSCTACPLGTFSATTQSAYETASWAGCVACPMGSFGARTGLAACSACPDGTYSAVVGSATAASCIQCPAGTYSNGNTTKAAACAPCGLATYASTTGTAGCTACPLNTITLATGATSSTLCVSCPIGSQRSLARATCEACPPGTHRLHATAGCALCPYGTYTSSLTDAQNTQCTGCSPMTYSSSVGSTACTPCPPGTYALNQWAACLPCSPACPIGRNGGVCSYHGNCSYSGCNCSDGFSGVACETLAPGLTSTTAANASGVLYFATPNMTLLFDNVSSNSVLLARDGGYLGTLSAVVALAGGNGSATNGGLPLAWAATVAFAAQQTSMSLSLPVAPISSGQGCTSIVLSLRNLNAGSVSNVSLTDGASLTLLVQATSVSTTALLQAPSTVNGFNSTVLVATTQSSSLSIPLALPIATVVETYIYLDTSLDLSYTPLLPALLAAVQQNYEAQGVDWRFYSNLNTTLSTFGHAASALHGAAQAIQVVDATSPFNAAPLLATNFLASIPWSTGARRTLLVVTMAPSINAATTTSTSLRTACVAANVVPFFLVPTAKQSTFSSLVQSFGAVVGFNFSSFPTSAWQALQTPCTPVASIVSTPSSSLLQSAVWTVNAVTLTFRRAVLGSDPAQMTSLVTVLGVAVLRITQVTFFPSCTSSVDTTTLPTSMSLAGWLPPMTTLASAEALWTAQSSASSLTLLSAINQSLVLQSTTLGQNASYGSSFAVQLELGTPVVLVGYVNTNMEPTTNAASIELVVNDAMRFPVSLPMAASSSAWTWQFFALVVNLPQTTSQLQVVLNTSRVLGVASLGLFVDGPYSCRCASGNYMRAGVCSRCPTGSACAGGIKLACAQQTFSFGAAATCRPCYPGWTCSGGFATPCPLGTYTLDATTCLVCPAGSACRQGLRSTCSVGTFALAGARHCSRCLPGTFANVTGSSACVACPPGQTSNYMRDHCLPCAPGGYANAPGSFPCAGCPANSFAVSGQSTCAVCPLGTWTPSAGAQQCEPCQLGVC